MEKGTKIYLVVERLNGSVGITNAYRSRIKAIVAMQEMFAAKLETEITTWVDITDKHCSTPHIHYADGTGKEYKIAVIERVME